MKKNLKIFKIGGGIIDDTSALKNFLYEFSKIKEAKILVHGGGRMVNIQLEKLGIPTQMINGRRITDFETLQVAVQFYAGLINKNIVAQLQKNNCNAIGLSGADGNAIISVKRPITEIDFGYVGDIKKKSINQKFIKLLVSNNYTPIFSAITHDGNGNLFNTNADTIAAKLAIALSRKFETELHYCFERQGVLLDVNDEKSILQNIKYEYYQELLEQKIIFDGMIPKLDNAFRVLKKGVKKVVLEHPENINNEIKTVLEL